MTRKENTKLINLLFEVYKKGVEGEECNLDDSLKKLLEAINYTRCSLQFNALLQKETEVVYKGIKYYIFLIDYNNEVASIKQVEGTWIEYNIPFKELTKSI